MSGSWLAGIEKAELLVQGVRALLDSPLDEASSKAATGSEVSALVMMHVVMGLPLKLPRAQRYEHTCHVTFHMLWVSGLSGHGRHLACSTASGIVVSVSGPENTPGMGLSAHKAYSKAVRGTGQEAVHPAVYPVTQRLGLGSSLRCSIAQSCSLL